MKKLFLFLLFAIPCYGQTSFGGSATYTTWTAKFDFAQSPGKGWEVKGHPTGLIDVQWRYLFGEAVGDPHRTGEASELAGGVRYDFLRRRHIAIFGQVALGIFEAPSWLEYCGSYEYLGGNCGAGAKPPEYCWWFTTDVGVGVRIPLRRRDSMFARWALEEKVEYLNPYAIGPRWRFSSGFRVIIK